MKRTCPSLSTPFQEAGVISGMPSVFSLCTSVVAMLMQGVVLYGVRSSAMGRCYATKTYRSCAFEAFTMGLPPGADTHVGYESLFNMVRLRPS